MRLYQAPDTAERFEASFSDNFSGWQKVTLPFSSFSRSAEQMAQAPNDGLGLGEVWGYGFEILDSQGTWYMDEVGLEP
ncbi:MAG: carbohydrate binding domain-containing protein [Deinococcales bacterium]